MCLKNVQKKKRKKTSVSKTANEFWRTMKWYADPIGDTFNFANFSTSQLCESINYFSQERQLQQQKQKGEQRLKLEKQSKKKRLF